MYVGQNDEALPMLNKLIELQPDNQTHKEKLALLNAPNTESRQEKIREYIEQKWFSRSDY